MAYKLYDELVTTPPKLSLSTFPSHKPLPPTPGALTPPLQPMVSVPFEWEEAPGRPRSSTISSPYKPKSFRCLELPPRLLVEAKVTHIPCSPTTVLDGPKVGRTLSHRFFLEDISPKGEDELINSFGPWKWASCNETKWDQMIDNHQIDLPSSLDKKGSVRSEVDINGRMTRFRKRTNRSLYKLSHKSSRLIENIYQSLKQVIVRRRKEGRIRNDGHEELSSSEVKLSYK